MYKKVCTVKWISHIAIKHKTITSMLKAYKSLITCMPWLMSQFISRNHLLHISSCMHSDNVLSSIRMYQCIQHKCKINYKGRKFIIWYKHQLYSITKWSLHGATFCFNMYKSYSLRKFQSLHLCKNMQLLQHKLHLLCPQLFLCHCSEVLVKAI